METTCRRCHGFIITIVINGEDQWFPAIKCVNCGEVRDREIDTNREIDKLRAIQRAERSLRAKHAKHRKATGETCGCSS